MMNILFFSAIENVNFYLRLVINYWQKIFNNQLDCILILTAEQLAKAMLALHCFPEKMDAYMQDTREAVNNWQA